MTGDSNDEEYRIGIEHTGAFHDGQHVVLPLVMLALHVHGLQLAHV